MKTILQVIQRVENAKWTDNLLQLQIWSRLAFIALEISDFSTAISCCDFALNLERRGKSAKEKKQTER